MPRKRKRHRAGPAWSRRRRRDARRGKLVPAGGGGSVETDLPNPVGEYAMSCLGRERIFQYFGEAMKIPIARGRIFFSRESPKEWPKSAA